MMRQIIFGVPESACLQTYLSQITVQWAQKWLHLFVDSEAYHEQMGPIPSSNGSLDIALSNAHT